MSTVNTNVEIYTDWRDYYELTKPRVVMLIVFTAIVGMFLRPWIGQWIDRVGARRMWLAGFGLFAASLVGFFGQTRDLAAAGLAPILVWVGIGAGLFALDVSVWRDPEHPDGPPRSFRDPTRNAHPDLPESRNSAD